MTGLILAAGIACFALFVWAKMNAEHDAGIDLILEDHDRAMAELYLQGLVT